MVLTEGRDRVGGNITTRSSEGYLWEEGPNSFQPSDAMLKAAVRTSGIEPFSICMVYAARRSENTTHAHLFV